VRVLVTGGAGFIGSRVTAAYLAAGYEVLVVDDLSHGQRSKVPAGARFEELDIRNPVIEEILRAFRPDVVNHHAAQVAVRDSIARPVYDADINVLGSLRLIEACRVVGVAKFIYSSSGGAAVGEPQYLPVDEQHPVLPLSPYGISKQTVEHYLRFYGQTHGLRYTVLRYANVYGPGQDAEGEAGVVAIFIRRMLADQEVVVYGDGQQTRDFVHVDDIVQGNMLALEHGDGGVYNLGTGQQTTINTIFSELKHITDYGRAPRHVPALPGEVRYICLDAGRAARELSWNAVTPLKEGLQQTVAASAQV